MSNILCCDNCSYVGENDEDKSVSTCHYCGETQKNDCEDYCPTCDNSNYMGAACPKCNGPYTPI